MSDECRDVVSWHQYGYTVCVNSHLHIDSSENQSFINLKKETTEINVKEQRMHIQQREEAKILKENILFHRGNKT